jgi:hypothetical protein
MNTRGPNAEGAESPEIQTFDQTITPARAPALSSTHRSVGAGD